MAITIKSIGHFFAKAYTAVKGELPKIESALSKVEATKGPVEAVTAVAAPSLVPVEDIAFAVLGEFSAVLATGGAAAAQKLQDAGLDINVVKTVQNLLATTPQIVAVGKAL